MATSAQSKVTDFFCQRRTHRSPSPKRTKPLCDRKETGIAKFCNIPQTPRSHSKVVACLPDDHIIDLELPPTYTLLLNWFRNADQLVAIMYNREELITFTKLQSGVQKMTRRNFGLKQLGQVKTIYPEAYMYEQQRLTRQASILQNRPIDYELVIKPNLTTDLSAYGLQTPVKTPRKRIDLSPMKTPPRTPTKRPYCALSPMKTPSKSITPLVSPLFSPTKDLSTAGTSKPFSGGRLIARSQVFRRNLFGILRRRHKKFLSSLSPPIQLSDEDETRLTSWHPGFLTNEQALEITSSELPNPPAVERIASAKELLATSRIGIQTKAATQKTSDDQKETSTVAPPKGCSLKSTNSLTKGLPPKLLEKIREKERQKKEMAMLRSPEEECRRLRLSRLPDFVRIINMYFATEGKLVLPLPQVHTKLMDSYASPMAIGEIAEHVKLLQELAPTWISQMDLGEKGCYLRINREFDVSIVLKTVGKST